MTDVIGGDDHRGSAPPDTADGRSRPYNLSSLRGVVGPDPETGPPVRWKRPYSLGDNGLTPDQRNETMASYREYIERQVHSFLGYQANQHAEYSPQLSWMLDHHVNNLGDPFTEGYFTVSSKEFERDVLDYFARLWRAKTPHDPDDGESYWGYVLSMGSTEANLYGLWNARDYLKGRALVRDPADTSRLLWVSATAVSPVESGDAPGGAGRRRDGAGIGFGCTPVAFYSADTHYSFTKAARVLDIPTFTEIGKLLYPDQCPLGGRWPDEVPSVDGDSGPGSIDVDKLCALVDFFAARGYPALLNLNVGTTFKGAYDPVGDVEPRIVQIMRNRDMYERVLHLPDGTPHGKTVTRYGFWIHVDGALGAAYLPYLRMAAQAGDLRDPRVANLAPVPTFDFALEHVFSISMSGHKWIGAPWPCGVYMTKTKYQLRPPDMPEFLGSPDTTFAGSRSGFSAVLLWEHLARYSHADQVDRALAAQEIAAYAVQQLTALANKLDRDLHVARTPLALTVRFLRPADKLVFTYSLSTETYLSETSVDYAHLFVMPGVTKELIDTLIDDLSKPGAFAEPAHTAIRAAVSTEAVSVADQPASATTADGTAVPLVGRGFQ
jgi:histidine decarboxylase